MRSFASINEIIAVVDMAHMSKRIDELLKKEVSKDEQKYLKYIRTYIDRYIVSLKNRIDNDSIERIKRKVFNYIPKLDALNSNDHQRVTMIEDDFYGTAELVMEKCCMNCKCEDVVNCVVRKCFADSLVPELNLGDENKPCPYVFKPEDLGIDSAELSGGE